MFIEAITTCVNYSDLFNLCIAENKKHFDRWIVVTTPNDTKTQELCQDHGVECLQTDIFYEDNSKFNQSKAINYGISHLDRKDWILSVDADVLLPKETRSIIESVKLEKHILYGVPRFNLTLGDCKYIQWISNWSSMRKNTAIDTLAGYFHLFHNSRYRPYYEGFTTVENKDVEFQNRFEIWGIIPMYVFHFGRSNWEGRESPLYPEFTNEEKEIVVCKLEEIIKETRLI